MFADKTLKELLDAFSSPEPTPGGGSAAALAGALGTSLLAMVAAMPKSRTNSPEDRAALDAVHPRLLAIRTELVNLADRDTQAYDGVVAAYRLPKATESEKAIRKAAVQAAMRTATEVPLETMRVCHAAIRAGEIVAAHGNPNAKSDVGAGLQMILAGLTGAHLNVEINIGSLTDPAVVEAIRRGVSTLGDAETSLTRSYDAAGLLELLRATKPRTI